MVDKYNRVIPEASNSGNSVYPRTPRTIFSYPKKYCGSTLLSVCVNPYCHNSLGQVQDVKKKKKKEKEERNPGLNLNEHTEYCNKAQNLNTGSSVFGG